MSHATYCFLVDGAVTENVAETANRFAERYEKRLDENNWWEPIALIRPDGELVQLAEKGDYRGRDEAAALWATVPSAERWTRGLCFAMGCVATDLGVRGVRRMRLGPERTAEEEWLEHAASDEILAAIYAEVPAKLAAAYSQIRAPFEVAVGSTGWFEDYQRGQLAAQFEALHRATWRPFADGLTPYEYRCHDLRTESDAAAEVTPSVGLLLIDIHT